MDDKLECYGSSCKGGNPDYAPTGQCVTALAESESYTLCSSWRKLGSWNLVSGTNLNTEDLIFENMQGTEVAEVHNRLILSTMYEFKSTLHQYHMTPAQTQCAITSW